MSAVFNVNSHSRDDSSSSLLNLRGPFVCRDCIAIPVPKLASIEAGRVVALQRTEAMHMASNRPRRHARGGRRCSRPKRGRVGCSRERPWVVRILPWKRQYFPCMRSQIHRTSNSTYIDHGRYGHDRHGLQTWLGSIVRHGRHRTLCRLSLGPSLAVNVALASQHIEDGGSKQEQAQHPAHNSAHDGDHVAGLLLACTRSNRGRRPQRRRACAGRGAEDYSRRGGGRD